MKEKLITAIITGMLVLVVIGCRKDRLKGGYEVFQGKWSYVYSIKVTSTFNQWTGQTTTSYDTLWAQALEDQYSIIFESNGKLRQLISEAQIKKSRIVFEVFKESFNCSNFMANAHLFEIHLNNNSDDRMVGCVGTDTIITSSNMHLPENLFGVSGGSSTSTYSHFYILND